MRILAGLLRDTLVPRDAFIQQKTTRLWRKPFLILAGIFLIAGIAAFLLVPRGWIIFTASIGAFGIFLALSSTIHSEDDTSLLDNNIAAARARWKKETGEEPGEYYEDVLSALDLATQRSRDALKNLERVGAYSAELEKNENIYAQKKIEAAHSADAAQRQLRLLLDEEGAADVNDYNEQLVIQETSRKQRVELEKKLESSLANYGAASIAELEVILRGEKDSISEKITESALSDQELRIKENLLRENEKRIAALNSEDKEKNVSHRGELATIQERLRGLPKKIADCEKSIQEKSECIKEIEKELDAKKIAQQLFESIAEDSSQMLDDLSVEISECFSSITEAKRPVMMKNFSTKDIDVTDAQGSGRGSEFLSTGTRDAFLLAARLILVRRSVEKERPAVIVLDEAFLALDSARTGRALAMLEQFRKETNWQIVLFTKDEETENQARAVFGKDLRIHKLG